MSTDSLALIEEDLGDFVSRSISWGDRGRLIQERHNWLSFGTHQQKNIKIGFKTEFNNISICET